MPLGFVCFTWPCRYRAEPSGLLILWPTSELLPPMLGTSCCSLRLSQCWQRWLSQPLQRRRSLADTPISDHRSPFLRDRSQLSRQEMVRRPRATNRNFAVLQLFGCAGIAVLVFFHGLGINQVGNIYQHSVGVNPLTTDFFLQRIEQPVYLH